MAYTLPITRKLKVFEQHLEVNYLTKRRLKDKASMFGFGLWFGETKNAERAKDIQFIRNIAAKVEKSKFNYAHLDPDFKDKDYSSEIATFLRKVMAGSMLLVLHRITQSYRYEERVKTGSVLAELILNLFEVEKLSEIPEESLKENYDALLKYLTCVKNHKMKDEIWYPQVHDEDLLTAIKTALANKSILLPENKKLMPEDEHKEEVASACAALAKS